MVAGEEYPLIVPFTDAAYLEDVACCLTLVAALAPQLLTVPEAWRALTSISMRLEVKDGLQGNTLIDDAYSCDLQSLSIALDFLRRRASATGARPVLLLSDIEGSGRSDADLYTEVAGLVKSYGVDEVFAVGEHLTASAGSLTLGIRTSSRRERAFSFAPPVASARLLHPHQGRTPLCPRPSLPPSLLP